MADKSVGELIAAQSVTPTDLFVLEQNGTAKKLTGQILENWLVSFADGHGGIQSIVKLSTSGLVDTYRITLADTTTFDFMVTNGKSIKSISKASTSGLVDTYRITFNDSTSSTFTVTNGEKGDKGDTAYIWIKYASQEPTVNSNSFGDVPDDWIGVYFGFSSASPTDWKQYKWYRIKGEKGDTGDPASLVRSSVNYQVGDSGTVIPSGSWQSSVPVVSQGKYLWTRTTNTFNTGDPVVSYSVTRMGLDGSGSVSSVANISPDENGNVPLAAENIGALSSTGGDMTGELRMNGQPISGMNMPTANDQAANMSFVNQQMKKAAPRNLLDNSDFRIAQSGYMGMHGEAIYIADRWVADSIISAKPGINGLEISGSHAYAYFYQMVEGVAGKKLTFAAKGASSGRFRIGIFDVNISVLYADGYADSGVGVCTATIPADMDVISVLIYPDIDSSSGNMNIEWSALYEGEYTAETLPEYQPKGYGAELAECQRYFLTYDAETVFSGYISGGATGFCFCLDRCMRITPTVTNSAKFILRTISGYSSATPYDAPTSPTSVSASGANAPYVTLEWGKSLGANNTPVIAEIASGKLEFSADL